VFIAFDLLLLDGDIRLETTLERRASPEWVLREPTTTIPFSEAVTGGGKAFYKAVDKLQLEGIVSKRASAPYVSGRTRS